MQISSKRLSPKALVVLLALGCGGDDPAEPEGEPYVIIDPTRPSDSIPPIGK